jgi:DMSO/TMAO reductase YedYZ heme-binding membrane subunit
MKLVRSLWFVSALAGLICVLLVGSIACLAPRGAWPSLMARGLGHLTFSMIALVLLTSPLARLHPTSRLALLVAWRKPIGIATLLPAVLHFAAVIWSTPDLRRFEIHPATDLPGFLAFCCLVALGVTTPQRVRRSMGSAKWKRLHRRLLTVAFAATIPAAINAEYWPLGVVAAALAILTLRYRWLYYRALGQDRGSV